MSLGMPPPSHSESGQIGDFSYYINIVGKAPFYKYYVELDSPQTGVWRHEGSAKRFNQAKAKAFKCAKHAMHRLASRVSAA